MHRFEATAVATLIALYATGCGHLKIYEISASTGSAPDLVFVERSSTNYVVVSNYLTTTNYWVPAQYFSPSGQKPVTNASGSNINANISAGERVEGIVERLIDGSASQCRSDCHSRHNAHKELKENISPT